jgi:hypothetical protein
MSLSENQPANQPANQPIIRELAGLFLKRLSCKFARLFVKIILQISQ